MLGILILSREDTIQNLSLVSQFAHNIQKVRFELLCLTGLVTAQLDTTFKVQKAFKVLKSRRSNLQQRKDFSYYFVHDLHFQKNLWKFVKNRKMNLGSLKFGFMGFLIRSSKEFHQNQSVSHCPFPLLKIWSSGSANFQSSFWTLNVVFNRANNGPMRHRNSNCTFRILCAKFHEELRKS